MAGVFDRMANNLKAFNLNQYLGDWLVDNEDFITGLNKKRLYGFGTYVDGEKIVTFKAQQENSGYPYAINTIRGTPEYQGKVQKSQPYDRVTLNDTGRAYDSFSVNAKSNSFSIEANDDKSDGKISDNVDFERALGLDDLKPLQTKLLPDLRKEILSILRS